jgi:hypothetical protein
VVDLGVEESAVRPNKASARLAILLLLGLLTFAGVVIIIMPISQGGLKLPDVECSDIVVARTPNRTSLMDVGGSNPIYDARYEIVIKNFHIPLPRASIRIFVKGSRCGQL